MSDGDRQKRRYVAIRIETLRRTTYHTGMVRVQHNPQKAKKHKNSFWLSFVLPCKKKMEE
jgi:hypothetical protein